MMIKPLFIVSAVLLNIQLIAQDTLTYNDALLLTLQKNRLIKIAENSSKIADEEASPGRAGLLPEVGLAGSVDYALNNTQIQVQNSPDVIRTTGAEQNSVRASVNLNYTIFSGFANKYRYNQLLLGVDLSKTQQRITTENIILQLATAYFNVLRTKLNMQALSETVEASKSRYRLADSKHRMGAGSSLELMNAEVDLNRDSATFISAQAAYIESIYTLNQLMGVELDSEFEYYEIIEYKENLQLEELIANAKKQNAELQNAHLMEEFSLLNYRISKSAYLPRLSLNSSYSYNNARTEGSFLRLNQSDGFGASLSLSVPIFTGGVNRSNIEIAEINQESVQQQREEIDSKMERDIRAAYTHYVNALRIQSMEERNSITAGKAFAHAEELFRSGTINSIAFRDAQLNLLLSKNSLYNAQYNAKLAELELLRLSGNLLVQNN